MKSIIPDPTQLDELAAGLDAGWDEEPAEASGSEPPLSPSSHPPHSAPLPAALAALDADWGDTESDDDLADSSGTKPAAAGAGAPRAAGIARISKRERREAERQRRAHQSQQNSASKKQRKAERLAAARQASEKQRAAEQQARAEHQKRQALAAAERAKKSPPNGPGVEAAAKRVAKRTPREQTAAPRAVTSAPAREIAASKSEPKPSKPVTVERGLQKLVVPLMIAVLVAVTLGFALSRVQH